MGSVRGKLIDSVEQIKLSALRLPEERAQRSKDWAILGSGTWPLTVASFPIAMINQQAFVEHYLPELSKLAPELVGITRVQRIYSLALPFFFTAVYFLFATLRWWPLAVLSLIALFCYLWLNIARSGSQESWAETFCE